MRASSSATLTAAGVLEAANVYEFELVEEEEGILAFPFDFPGGTQGCDLAEASKDGC